MFENNGVIKRDLINQIIKKLTPEDRSNLKKKGIKIGRYHIFLPRMFKPSAVTLRVTLWKVFFQDSRSLTLPKFGLNFLTKEKENKEFLLICGFENFDKFYIRVDILERLFLKIIQTSKNSKFKMNSDMMNLIGINKENFIKLLKLMSYKWEAKEETFTYMPKRNFKKINKSKISHQKNNPFEALAEVRFK